MTAETRPEFRIVTTDTIAGVTVAPGGVVHACAVSGANVLRDMREAITNTIGGQMVRYEKLLDQTIARALDALADRARAEGYDAIVGLRLSHPVITDGAIEIVVIGTGAWIRSAASETMADAGATLPPDG